MVCEWATLDPGGSTTLSVFKQSMESEPKHAAFVLLTKENVLMILEVFISLIINGDFTATYWPNVII